MTGQTIAYCQISTKLGQCGMGAVFRARDTRLNRDGAIKVLPEAEGIGRIDQRALMDASELNELPAPYLSDPEVAIPADRLAEFEAAARRPLETRFRYAFIHTFKPILDEVPFRAFDTTADYRRWCEENLPDWLGYGRV